MKRNIQLLQFDPSFDLKKLNKAYIIVDTNFLIDSFNYKQSFEEVIQKFKNEACVFLTLNAVLFEFTQGSKSLEYYKKKLELYNNIIDTTLPIEPALQDNVSSLSKIRQVYPHVM